MKLLVLIHEHYDSEHLAAVKSEMQSLGAPTLKGLETEDSIYLLEGCHRARAAKELGLPIQIEIVYADDDELVNDVLGYQGFECDDDVKIGSLYDGYRLTDRCLEAEYEII